MMNEFNQASQDFKNALKDRTRRQLKIIKAVQYSHPARGFPPACNADRVMLDLKSGYPRREGGANH